MVKTLQNMLGKQKRTDQFPFFDICLDQLIDMDHLLSVLAREVNWEFIEGEIALLFSHTGRPSVPARSIVGLLMLKRMFDESVVVRWIENPYWQYFTGEEYFRKGGLSGNCSESSRKTVWKAIGRNWIFTVESDRRKATGTRSTASTSPR